MANGFRRGVRHRNLVASLLGWKKQTARRHRAATCARALHQVSARFRPRTMTDSPALHPLHSSRSSPAFRRNSIGSMPGLRSFVPTAANSRDSQNSSCAPGKAKHRWSRGFARPRPAIWCDASHITPDQSNMAARLRPARTTALTVSTAISDRYTTLALHFAVRKSGRPH